MKMCEIYTDDNFLHYFIISKEPSINKYYLNVYIIV